MNKSFTQLQALSVEQGEHLQSLFTLGFEGAQGAIAQQVATIRRILANGAPAALAGGEFATGELARSLVQDWTDFLQSSQGMNREAQEIARRMAESNLRALNALFTAGLAALDTRSPANQEAIDIAVRSWQATAESAFAQAAEWQKQMEQASAQGSAVLSSLATQKTPGTAKRRAATTAA